MGGGISRGVVCILDDILYCCGDVCCGVGVEEDVGMGVVRMEPVLMGRFSLLEGELLWRRFDL